MTDLDLVMKNKEVDPKSWQTFRERQIEPKIRNEAGEQGIGFSPNQEFAFLRKSIKSLYEFIAKQHPEVIYTEAYLEFMAYCDGVEKIVQNFELNITKNY